MFGNFAKLDSPRRLVQFWQNFQTSLVLLIPNCTRERMITYTNSRVLKYADDAVIYCSGKDVERIEVMLSYDMDLIAKYLEENELIMNLEKGKTEVMLFGTAKRLSMQSRELDVRYK